MVVFIASSSPLPLVAWENDAPAFHVKELADYEERVRSHFSVPNVRYAGSHTACGCGFNEGREYPEVENDPKVRADAIESASRLMRYITEHRVEEVYSCWSGDEGMGKEFERRIKPDALVAGDFFFRERELLRIDPGG
jgi:hypothetical protein